MLMLPIIKPLNESAQTEKSLDSLGPGFAPEESAEGICARYLSLGTALIADWIHCRGPKFRAANEQLC